jgi:hypothetical protein
MPKPSVHVQQVFAALPNRRPQACQTHQLTAVHGNPSYRCALVPPLLHSAPPSIAIPIIFRCPILARSFPLAAWAAATTCSSVAAQEVAVQDLAVQEVAVQDLAVQEVAVQDLAVQEAESVSSDNRS